MGLVLALLLGLAVLLGLWRMVRLDRGQLQLLAAILCFALAGYAWQGSPSLPGRPAPEQGRESRPDSDFARTREVLLGRFDRADMWLTIADSYQRRGDTWSGVGIIRSGLRQNPQNWKLWTGLGNALVLHAEGAMTPAAELAFARAAELAPGHPAPRFYYGSALAMSGRLAEAEAVWRELLEKGPAEGAWRPLTVERLALVQRIRAAIEAAPATAQ